MNTYEVYNKLADAYGTNKSAPELVFLPKGKGKKNILMYYPGSNSKIEMDEEVYDVCVRLGKDSLNALAALLGHELAHHYENHNWCSSFAYLLDEKDELKGKLGKLSSEEKLRIEAEADYIGGFYGYVAGYPTFDISAKLLDEIYKHYRLPEKLRGYPSKTERKEIAKKSLQEIEQYKMVFDFSEAMLCLKEYDLASASLEYLSGKFPSREIYGNAALSKILEAAELTDREKMPFALPLEFDASTRLKSGKVRSLEISEDEKELKKKKLLSDAILLCDKAIMKDPNYVQALLLKGSAFILSGNAEMALGISNQILEEKEKYSKATIANVYSIMGASYFVKGEKNKAKEYFELANEVHTSIRNTYNHKLAKEYDKDFIDILSELVYAVFEEEEQKTYGKEKAINPSLEKTDEGFNSLEKITVPLPFLNPNQSFYYRSNAAFQEMHLKRTKEYRIVNYKNGFSGVNSQGIRVGDSVEKIMNVYGQPTYSLDEVKGQYLVYRKSRIVFYIGKDAKVKRWFVYF